MNTCHLCELLSLSMMNSWEYHQEFVPTYIGLPSVESKCKFNLWNMVLNNLRGNCTQTEIEHVCVLSQNYQHIFEKKKKKEMIILKQIVWKTRKWH